jgi:site-specific DNA-cytosine methylase
VPKDVTLNLLECFAGCGGLSSGFRLPSINVKWAIDYDKSAAATYTRAHEDTKVL